ALNKVDKSKSQSGTTNSNSKKSAYSALGQNPGKLKGGTLNRVLAGKKDKDDEDDDDEDSDDDEDDDKQRGKGQDKDRPKRPLRDSDDDHDEADESEEIELLGHTFTKKSLITTGTMAAAIGIPLLLLLNCLLGFIGSLATGGASQGDGQV